MSAKLRSIHGTIPGRNLTQESATTPTTVETRLDVYECSRGHRFALCRHAAADFILGADCRCGAAALLADAPCDAFHLPPTGQFIPEPKTHMDHVQERRTPRQRAELLDEALAKIAA